VASTRFGKFYPYSQVEGDLRVVWNHLWAPTWGTVRDYVVEIVLSQTYVANVELIVVENLVP
jgi:hypothetical protein